MKDNNISLNDEKDNNGKKKGGGALMIVSLAVFAVISVTILYAYMKSPERAARVREQNMSQQGVLVPDLTRQYDEASALESLRRENQPYSDGQGNAGGTSGAGAMYRPDASAASSSAASSLLEEYYKLAPYADNRMEECIVPTEAECRANGVFALIRKSNIDDDTVQKFYLNKDYYKRVMEGGGNALGMAIPYKVYVYPETLDLLSQTVEATIDSYRYLITYTKDKDGLINSIMAREI